MWLENGKHKNMLHAKRNKFKKKKNGREEFKDLILKQCQSADLKNFWNWFEISDLCKGFR